jgi:5-methyltetrahydrofolate--homocysteine methyltransferase
MALTERTDEAAQMRALVKKLSLSVEAPLCIDSTEANVIEAALEACPGSAIVNSINLENGRERVDSVMPLVMKHGAAVIALTIDETGMAKTAARTTASGATSVGADQAPDLRRPRSRSPRATGVRALRRGNHRASADQERHVALGRFNVSFGLGKARAVLVGVFYRVQAGLDAIVNPADVIPVADLSAEDRRLAEDLVFAREPQALANYITHFEGRAPDARMREDEAAESSMSVEQRIHHQILHRKPAGIESLVDEAVKRRDPVAVLNTVLCRRMGGGRQVRLRRADPPFVCRRQADGSSSAISRELRRVKGPHRAGHRVGDVHVLARIS